MPKIQGKQIADKTIDQKNLSLVTPLSGDTLSGATVEYVNNKISSSSGIIGTAEDGSYSDGLFTDFTENTPTGTAVDRFNETLLKLAPTPPSDLGSQSLNMISSTYTANALTSGSATGNITSDTTPQLRVPSTTEGIGDSQNGTLEFDVDSSVQETVTFTTGDDTKTTGVIRFNEGDPYAGVSGKENFWQGIVSNIEIYSTSLSASGTQKSANLTHSTTGSVSENFYVDDPQSPTVGTISANAPTMSNYISGVPSLASGDSISNISFDITNAVSYFYNSSLYDITGGLINNNSSNSPSTIPTTHGETINESGHSVTVANNAFSDTSLSFNVTARSADGSSNSNSYSTGSYRVDTVSDESNRLTSGSGNYPSTGYGGAYDSTETLTGVYTDEMMLKNGTYQYPNGTYTTFTDATNGAGPDYSSVSGTRWATFNLGTFNNNSSFVLNINGASGISSIGQANLYIEVKIDGATYWVDGDASHDGVSDPGSTTDGTAAVTNADPTARRITFGSITYSGNIIVRIGFTGTGLSFTNLTASDIT